MATSRNSHIPKNRGEREQYWRTRIGASSSPTAERSSFGFDSTDTPHERDITDEHRRFRPRSSGRVREFFSEYGLELFLAALSTILLGVLAWGGHELYRLNREVGEVSNQVSSMNAERDISNNTVKAIEKDLEKTEERLSDRITNLEQRVDHIYSREAN